MKKLFILLLLLIIIRAFANENPIDNKEEIQFNKQGIQDQIVIEKHSRIELASYIVPPDLDHKGYYKIALGFAQIRNFRLSLKYANKIVDQESKDKCYYMIISEMVASQLVDRAIKTVKEIKEEYFIKKSYETIIEHVIEKDLDYDKAIQLSKQHQDDEGINETLILIVKSKFKNSKIENVIEFINTNIPVELIEKEIVKLAASEYLYRDDLEGLYIFMGEINLELNNDNRKIIINNANRLNKTHLIKSLFEELDIEDKEKEYVRLSRKLIRENKHAEVYEILAKIQNIKNRDQIYFYFAQPNFKDRNIDRALLFADSMSTIEMKDQLYYNCAKVWSRYGDLDIAIQLLHKISDVNKKEEMASRIALILYISGDYVKYEKVIQMITNVYTKEDLYKQIILKMLRRNKFDQIEEYLVKITDKDIKDTIFIHISERKTRFKEFEKAIKYAERIVNEDARNTALDRIEERRNN